MTSLEQKQAELIKVLTGQVSDLSMMSKIELGDDVIIEITKLSNEIIELRETYVPFVSEVETFNKTMGKKNKWFWC